MKKIAILLLFIATAATAGLFDKDIKVKFFPICDSKNSLNKDNFIIFTFVVDKNSVTQKQEYYTDKILKKNDLKRLDNCIVVDKANWKCGGDSQVMPNGAVWKNDSHQAINGKYTYTENTRNGASFGIPFCKIEQLN